MKTHTHILSSDTTSAYTSGGVEAYDTGPTNLIISFSGANIAGDTYIKFLVKYDGDDAIYTVSPPTDNLDSIRTQTASKTFYPGPDFVTSYMVDVSGVKNTLNTDRYRINLKLGHEPANKFKDIRVANSTLYTNKEVANYLLVTLEGQNPRYAGNLVIPYYKDPKYYITPPGLPFTPDDNVIIRLEVFSQQGGYVPLVIEDKSSELVAEEQNAVYAFFTDNADMYGGTSILHWAPGIYGTRKWSNGRQGHWINEPGFTTGEKLSGDDLDDYLIFAPEVGIDYSNKDIYAQGGIYEDDSIINVTIVDIFEGGVAP